MTDPDLLRAAMVAELTERGALDGSWREAMLAVSRHAFLPDTMWERTDVDPDDGNDLLPVHRYDDPEGWLHRSYADRPVITQVDDGQATDPRGGPQAGREATSSASMPSVVAEMLTALDLAPGMRVLEIGTGTGYNAALLAHRVGAENVTSIEIHPAVADRARAALTATGHGAVTVITGDGAYGHPEGAPFNRVIATAAVQEVPYAWVTQTLSGGLVITPWTTTYYPSGLLVLTVAGGGTATGRIGSETSFMQLRNQRIPRFRASEIITDTDTASVSHTDVHAARVVNHERHVETAIGLRVPRCENVYVPHTDATGELWFVDQWSRSWATLAVHSEPPYEVRQSGPRRLWDEIAAAYQWWLDAGEPDTRDWAFTITRPAPRSPSTRPLLRPTPTRRRRRRRHDRLPHPQARAASEASRPRRPRSGRPADLPRHGHTRPGGSGAHDCPHPSRDRVVESTRSRSSGMSRNVHQTSYELLRERRITADTALRLARYLGTSEAFWLTLQSRYDWSPSATGWHPSSTRSNPWRCRRSDAVRLTARCGPARPGCQRRDGSETGVNGTGTVEGVGGDDHSFSSVALGEGQPGQSRVFLVGSALLGVWAVWRNRPFEETRSPRTDRHGSWSSSWWPVRA